MDYFFLHWIYIVGNTYNRVYIWCCKYGENRYCERCANKKWCASKHAGLLNSCLGKLCLLPHLVVSLISARVTIISTRVSAHCQAILLEIYLKLYCYDVYYKMTTTLPTGQWVNSSVSLMWICVDHMNGNSRLAAPRLVTLQRRHNGCGGNSNHQPHHCLLNRLFRRRSKKTPKLRVTGLCAVNSPVTGDRWIPRTNGQ